jgi:hypothetical protein
MLSSIFHFSILIRFSTRDQLELSFQRLLCKYTEHILIPATKSKQYKLQNWVHFDFAPISGPQDLQNVPFFRILSNHEAF